MDSTGCTPVKCICTCSDTFYFEVGTAETDVEEDTFTMSMCKSRWVRSEDNKFLHLTTDGQFQVQNLTELPREKFQIQVYRDSTSQRGQTGRAVILYMKSGRENMVVCCDDNHKICSRRMETLPKDIEDDSHPALFYMRQLSTDRFEFESSSYKSEYLGFEPDGDNPSHNKLVLHKKNQTEVDFRGIVLV
ncbi:interleukin-18-like isoform X2 [Gasterosteus aculeatus]